MPFLRPQTWTFSEIFFLIGFILDSSDLLIAPLLLCLVLIYGGLALMQVDRTLLSHLTTSRIFY